MARTKACARKGQDGRDYRDNTKRKREEAGAEQAAKRKGQGQDPDRPIKKAKSTSTTTVAALPTSHQAPPTTSTPQAPHQTPTNQTAPPNPPTPQPNRHAPNHAPLHHHLHLDPKKVSQILSILSTFSFSDPLPHVVLLSAKAPSSCKLISIVEIAKRELARKGVKWFQYGVVGELATVVPRGKGDGNGKGAVKDREVEEGEGEGEGMEECDVEMKDSEEGEGEDEGFETMKTPFERMLEAENRPKIRGVATLTLYLSRVRIESLKKIHGEQTNALT